jgi:broad specificity phosphatase PhoE
MGSFSTSSRDTQISVHTFTYINLSVPAWIFFLLLLFVVVVVVVVTRSKSQHFFVGRCPFDLPGLYTPTFRDLCEHMRRLRGYQRYQKSSRHYCGCTTTTRTMSRFFLPLHVVVAIAIAMMQQHSSALAFCPSPVRATRNYAVHQQDDIVGYAGDLFASSSSSSSFQAANSGKTRKQLQEGRHQSLLAASKMTQHDESDDDSSKEEEKVEQDNTSSSSSSSCEFNRRDLLQSILSSSSLLLTILSTRPSISQARGLIQFPITQEHPLLNQYHFLSCGISLLEEQDDIWSTNPLFLTNRESALSATGQAQVQAACRPLATSLKLLPTVVRYSLAASCCDAATIISRELRLGTDRVIPEYTFLDPRAIGAWDMTSRIETAPILYALDHDLAGVDGTGGRPPPTTDGTPNETLADQAVRLRQLLSLLETLYSGDTILLVFPDTTGPALLSCIMANIAYSQCHVLEFAPGELRTQITPASTLALYTSRIQDARFMATYQATLQRGRVQLQQLGYYKNENKESLSTTGLPNSDEPRTTTTATTTLETDGSGTRSTTVKDDDMATPAPATTLVNKKDAKIEAERLEVERKYAQEQQVKQTIQAERDEALRQQRLALIQQQRLEKEAAQRQLPLGRSSTSNEMDIASPISPQLLGGLAVLGGLAAAQNALFGGNKNMDEESASSVATQNPSSTTPSGTVTSNKDVLSTAATGTASLTTNRGSEDAPAFVAEVLSQDVDHESTNQEQEDASPRLQQRQGQPVVNGDSNISGSSSSSSSSLYGESSSSSLSLKVPPTESDRRDAAEKAMENYLNQDDGAQDWILSLTEIIEEEEDGGDDDTNRSKEENDEKKDQGVSTIAKE